MKVFARTTYNIIFLVIMCFDRYPIGLTSLRILCIYFVVVGYCIERKTILFNQLESGLPFAGKYAFLFLVSEFVVVLLY